jgi:uncharacterized protein
VRFFEKSGFAAHATTPIVPGVRDGAPDAPADDGRATRVAARRSRPVRDGNDEAGRAAGARPPTEEIAPMANEGLHEAAELLDAETVDRHRAIVSVMEELEAVDWYDQRIRATGDEELAAILRHNRDEEKEHAAMVLEWIRRRDPELDRQLRAYLFSEGSITDREDD